MPSHSPRAMLAQADKLLLHPWMARVGAAGTLSLVVGVVIGLVHRLGHVLKHVSALTLTSDVLVVAGLVALAAVVIGYVRMSRRGRLLGTRVDESASSPPAGPMSPLGAVIEAGRRAQEAQIERLARAWTPPPMSPKRGGDALMARRRAIERATAADEHERVRGERIKREIKQELADAPTALDPALRRELEHAREHGLEQARRARRARDDLNAPSLPPTSITAAFVRETPLDTLTWNAEGRARRARALLEQDDSLAPYLAQFPQGPPRAHPAPTEGDYERLASYYDEVVGLLEAVLAERA